MKQMTRMTAFKDGKTCVSGEGLTDGNASVLFSEDDVRLQALDFQPGILGICVTELPYIPEHHEYCTKEEAEYFCTWRDGFGTLCWVSKPGDAPVFGYAKRRETREEYLRRTVPEGYEWLGVGTDDKDGAPKFLGRSISVHSRHGEWTNVKDSRYHGNSRGLYYIRKIEAREEYLKRTMPEGYEWLGKGISTTLMTRFPNGFIGRAAWHDDWDEQDSTLRGSDNNLYYCLKKETREEYLKRTMPEGYEWVGLGKNPNGSAVFIGKCLRASEQYSSTWDDAPVGECWEASTDKYYIRRVRQTECQFDPQVGSKWRFDPLPKDTHTVEKLSSGKYVLLNQNQVRFCPAAHCAKDAFGGKEDQFTQLS